MQLKHVTAEKPSYVAHPQIVLGMTERLWRFLCPNFWKVHARRRYRELVMDQTGWDGKCPHCSKWLFRDCRAHRYRETAHMWHYRCHCGGYSHWHLELAPFPVQVTRHTNTGTIYDLRQHTGRPTAPRAV